MKIHSINFFLFLFFHFATACFPLPDFSNRLDEREQAWKEFKSNFSKVYSENEEPMRKNLFLLRRVQIIEHNKRFARGEVNFFKTINQFSDMVKKKQNIYQVIPNSNIT